MRINSKVAQNLKQLFEVQLHRHDFNAAEQTLDALDLMVNESQTAHEHQQMAFAIMRNELHNPEQALMHIKKAVKGFLKGDDNRALQKFLSTLEALNPSYAN